MDHNNSKNFYENWMKYLYPYIKHKRLIDLRIPGSHDSNTNTLKKMKYLHSYAKCQEISVKE